jgi:hypothetical protein
MENGRKSTWIRFWRSLEQYTMALEYDPLEELHARISLLENKVQALRRGATVTTGEGPGNSKHSPG